MTTSEMVQKIKSNLDLCISEHDLMISDVIFCVCDYCNVRTERIPEALEPFIRKKVKGIIDYESVNGSGFVPEVQSIKEGDGTVTWAQTEGNTKGTIYGLSDSDKKDLRRHRRLRGYV